MPLTDNASARLRCGLLAAAVAVNGVSFALPRWRSVASGAGFGLFWVAAVWILWRAKSEASSQDPDLKRQVRIVSLLLIAGLLAGFESWLLFSGGGRTSAAAIALGIGGVMLWALVELAVGCWEVFGPRARRTPAPQPAPAPPSPDQ